MYHWDHGWYGREGFIKKWLKRLYFGLATGAFIYGDRANTLKEKIIRLGSSKKEVRNVLKNINLT